MVVSVALFTVLLAFSIPQSWFKQTPDIELIVAVGLLLLAIINGLLAAGLPFAGVGYGIYRYLTWVGSGQRSVTIAFVGSLLIKPFLIPFLKGLETGAIFKKIMDWLRGDKVEANGAEQVVPSAVEADVPNNGAQSDHNFRWTSSPFWRITRCLCGEVWAVILLCQMQALFTIGGVR